MDKARQRQAGEGGWRRRFWSWMVGALLVGMVLVLTAREEAEAGTRVETGEVAPEAAPSDDDAGQTGFGLSGASSYAAPAAFKGATMAVWRNEARISWERPRFGFDLGWTGDWYDFARAGRLPFGGKAPFRELHMVDGGVTLRGPLWRRADFFLGLRGSCGFERSPGDGFGLAAMAGAAMPLGPDWRVTLGAGLSWSRVESQVFPVVGVRYEPVARPGFKAILAFPRSEISWRPDRLASWGVRVTGSVEDGLYKLSDDHAVAPDGYVVMFGGRLGAWLDLWPARGMVLSLGALYALPGQMSFYRESGSRIKRYDVGGAPGGAAQLRYEF